MNTNSLHARQSGFRPKHFTESALLEEPEIIKMTLDAGNNAVLILLDLSAVFDTISYTILLQRMQEIGISHKAVAWIRSFLIDRRKVVTFGQFSSVEISVAFGVPQSLSLSPAPFNIYMTPHLPYSLHWNRYHIIC